VEYALRQFSHFKIEFNKDGGSSSHDKHFSIRRYLGKFRNDMLCKGIDVAKFFKFCFVRNPWDRLVSNYEYLKDVNSDGPRTDYGYASFKDWILGRPSQGKGEELGVWIDRFRCPDNNAAIPTQISTIKVQNKVQMDFIGRFENLQEDFNKVCEHINVEKQQLPRKVKSAHVHFSQYYDNETKRIVAEQFAEDINFFNYDFPKS